jgi:hypothetical protein
VTKTLSAPCLEVIGSQRDPVVRTGPYLGWSARRVPDSQTVKRDGPLTMTMSSSSTPAHVRQRWIVRPRGNSSVGYTAAIVTEGQPQVSCREWIHSAMTIGHHGIHHLEEAV